MMRERVNGPIQYFSVHHGPTEYAIYVVIIITIIIPTYIIFNIKKIL